MIKLIGFDLDDTLLNSKKEIGDKDSVVEAIKKGVKVVFCSGRPLVKQTIDYYQELGFVDEAYYVAYNGVVIYKVSNGEVVYMNNLKSSDLGYIYNTVKLEADLLDGDYALYVHYDNTVYTDKINPFVNLENHYNHIEVIKRNYWEEKDFVAHKFMVGADPKDIAVLYQKIKDKFPEYTCLISMPCFIEIFKKDVDKYQGLLRVAEMYEIEENEIMAFGDSMNDYPMVKNAAIGIAMGNSVAEIKKVSDFVTDDNDHFGITKALKKYNVI